MSEKFIFTTFCCFSILSKLKYEVEANFDLTDNMMTGTERVFFKTYFQNYAHGKVFPVWKIPLF